MSEMQNYDAAVAAMGEQAEVGGQAVTLPESYYPMKLAIEDCNAYDDSMRGGEMVEGGVYLALVGKVLAGPYAGAEVRSRVNLNAGSPNNKSVNYLAYLNKQVKEVCGSPVNAAAMAEYAFQFPNTAGLNPRDAALAMRVAFRDQFIALPKTAKLALMKAYCRVPEWDGKQVIVKVGVREVKSTDENTGEERVRYFNDFLGFYGMMSEDHGLSWWKKQIQPEQESWEKENK